MDLLIKLLAYNEWAAEDDKTGFLSVGVDIFDGLYLKERPIYLPMVTMSTKTENMRNEDNRENSINRNMWFFDEWSRYYVWLYPPYGKTRNIEKCQSIIFYEFSGKIDALIGK